MTSIEDGAFSSCTGIKGSLDLWDSKITKLNVDAFWQTELTNLTLPLKLNEEGCSGNGSWPNTLDSLFLPGVKVLKKGMITLFKGSTLLFTGLMGFSREVNNLRKIEAGAFLSYQSGLTHVYVWGYSSSWKAVDSNGNQVTDPNGNPVAATFKEVDPDERAQSLCKWLFRYRVYDCIRTDV